MGDVREIQQTFQSGQSTIVLTPAGAAVRSPAAPATFTTPVVAWLITNHGAVDVWVNFDANAAVGTGYKLPPGYGKRLPVITKQFISTAGGDGSDVDCDPFEYEDS